MTENAHHKEILEKPSQIGIKVVIVNPRGEVLLLKRNAAAYGDGLSYWDIPGGRVDASVDVDEIINEGVVHPELARELHEEINWTPEKDQHIQYVAHQEIVTSAHENVDRYTFILQTNHDIPIQLSAEHADYAWVSTDTLKHMENLGRSLKSLVMDNTIPNFLKPLP